MNGKRYEKERKKLDLFVEKGETEEIIIKF